MSNSADLSSVDGRGGHLLGGGVGVSTGNESVGNASSGGKGKESLHYCGWLGFLVGFWCIIVVLGINECAKVLINECWSVSESVLDAGTETKISEAGCMQPFLYEERCMFPFLPFSPVYLSGCHHWVPATGVSRVALGPEYELSAERTLFW